MSKSMSTRPRRLLQAGLVTGAIATMLLASATAALAANVAVTLAPTGGPAGGGTAVTATGTGAFPAANTNLAGRMTTATCPATFGTTSATNPTFAVTRATDNTATFTSPAHIVPGSFKFCVYGAATAIAATTPIVANGVFVVTAAVPVVSPTAGPSTPGGTITATATGDYLSTVTTLGATLTTGTCADTYTTTSPNIVASATKNTDGDVATITLPSGLTIGSSYKACLYNGTTAGTSVKYGASTTAYLVLPGVTVSPAVGPTAGTNTITATSTTAILAGVSAPGGLFTRLECPAQYATSVDALAASSITRISNYKAAFTVPAGVALVSPETTAAYKLCIYEGTAGTDDLIAAPGGYTIAPILAVTSAAPTGGPAQGGSRVLITGTGFPPLGSDALLTASIGGAPLTDIEKVNTTTFWGTTSAHSPGTGLSISVTTAAGTKSGGTFAFSYGITVAPNTAPNSGTGSSLYLDVQGAGFDALSATFGAGTPALSNAATPHVYLVDGTYDNTTNGSAGKTVPQVDECASVVVISDFELICLLDLTAGITNATPTAAGGAVPIGTYTVTVVNDGAIGATVSASIISSGSTFTVAPY